MKKLLFVFMMLVLALSCAACGGGEAEEPADAPAQEQPGQEPEGGSAEVEKIIIKIGHSSNENNTYQDVCEAFKEKAEELLGADRVEVQIFPNATLGTEGEMTEAMQMGTLEAAVFGRHASIDPRLEIFNLPFLYADDAHAKAVLRGEEGAEVRQIAADYMYDNGIVLLGFYESGFREITSNKEIYTMDDLKGLLIRTAISDSLVAAFTSWGASPTPIDFSELYTALQTKVVDAQENPYQLIYTSNFYEVQSCLCITNHMMIPYQVVFSAKIWDSYPEDVRAALTEAGAYAANAGGEANVQQNSELLDTLDDMMTVTEMDADSLAQMKELAATEVWPQFVSEEDGTQELLDMIQSLAQ